MLVLARVSLVVASLVVSSLGLAACEKDTGPTRNVSLVVVVNGAEYYWGNDQYRTQQDCKSPAIIASGAPCRITKIFRGVFSDLSAALPAVAAAARPGIHVAVIAYSEPPEVKYEGPIADLTIESLGSQADQGDHVRGDRQAAIAAALDRLERAPSGHRQLVIIGEDIALPGEDLAPLKARAARANVEVISLFLDVAAITADDLPTPRRSALSTLGRTRTLRDPAELRTALPAAVTP